MNYMSCIFDNLIETWHGDRRCEKSRYLKTQVTDVKSRFSKQNKNVISNLGLGGIHKLRK